MSIIQDPGRVARSMLALSVLLAVAGGNVSAQQADPMVSRMILELQQMREEVRELRGMVEAQSQEIENLRRRQRDQYIDLDQRLGSIGSGQSGSSGRPGASAASADPSIDRAGNENGFEQGRAASARSESLPESPPAPSMSLPEVREEPDPEAEILTLAQPGPGGSRELQAPSEAEQQAYDQAFLALRETRYADAAEGFDRFLGDYAQSSYAPNALYWLGEVYYVTRDFETALAQFERLLTTYPDSSKQPDALLKIGFSHYEQGRWERARGALEQVIADYPGTNYSRLAENRLRTMRLEGHL
ncbi:MAG: tol-pal system protein YbgF [Wenzhouxiangellaceae bacterium]